MNSDGSEAIVVWSGFGVTTNPARDDERVVERFGARAARDLLPGVHALEAGFYRSDAGHVIADLEEVGRVASAEFRERHPEVSELTVQALAWCYAFDNKVAPRNRVFLSAVSGGGARRPGTRGRATGGR